MKTKIKCNFGSEDIVVDVDAENISIWQKADLIMLFDAKMARKFVKAIKKGMRELNWIEKDLTVSRDITVTYGAGGILLKQSNPYRGPDYISIETKEQLEKLIKEMQAAKGCWK
jgi:hypothetical protein